MPHVQRSAGRVVGIFTNPQPGYAEEYLEDDHADVVAYLNPPPNPDDLKPYQATRKSLYQERILTLKGAPAAEPLDAVGFILDAIITAVATGDKTELLAIAQEVAKVKQEVPKP